jgi:hypothetical protein
MGEYRAVVGFTAVIDALDSRPTIGRMKGASTVED